MEQSYLHGRGHRFAASDLKDGWALVEINHSCRGSEIVFHSPLPDLRFLVPGRKLTIHPAPGELRLRVPQFFISQHEAEINQGLKSTLMALLELDVTRYYDQIPFNLICDDKFATEYVARARELAGDNEKIHAYLDLVDEDKANLKEFAEKHGTTPKTNVREGVKK